MATTSDTIGWADRFDRDTTAASEIDVRHWHRASRNPLPTARRAPPDNEFALITTRAEFDTLAGDWNSLFARCGRSTHAFQTFNWCSHWADHFLGGERDPTLAIVTARRRGRLVLVAPLVVERFAGLKIVTWLGAPVSQYGDIIAEEGPHLMPALRRAWAFLIDTVRPDAVRLNKTRADAVVGPLLDELGLRTTQRQIAPYIDFGASDSYAAFETRYPARDRKNRRRLNKRLQETGTVELTRTGVEVSPALGSRMGDHGRSAGAAAIDVVEMKRRWLTAKGLVSPALTDPRFAPFFAAAASSTDRPAGVAISALTISGKPIAMEIAIECRERASLHVIAYEQGYEKFGPGSLLMERSLESRLDRGFAVVDLLAPGSAYKQEWTDTSVEVLDRACGFGVAGRIYADLFLAVIRPRLKAAVEAMPVKWRRRLGAHLGSGYA